MISPACSPPPRAGPTLVCLWCRGRREMTRSETLFSEGAVTRRGGLGVYTPIFGDFLPRATIFLVLTAFNSVLPELVVLISTTNSGGTALNAADRILTRKVVARGSKIGVSTPSPPRLISRQPEPSLRYRACVRKTRCFHLSGTLKVEHFPSVTSLPFPPCPSDPVCVATRSVYQRE